MPTQHQYTVDVEWTGGREGHGSVTAETSGTTIAIAVPPEFQGPGGASNPEELLTSAVAGCYTITFGIISANRKLPVTHLEVKAVGTVEQNGASLVYTQIKVMPKITVASDASDAQVTAITDMAHKADNYCIITNAIRGKVEVLIEPEVIRLS